MSCFLREGRGGPLFVIWKRKGPKFGVGSYKMSSTPRSPDDTLGPLTTVASKGLFVYFIFDWQFSRCARCLSHPQKPLVTYFWPYRTIFVVNMFLSTPCYMRGTGVKI